MQIKVNQIKFNREADKEFVTELRTRVKNYFKDNGLSRYGNGNMKLKTIFMLSLYFVPYGLMISGLFTQFITLLGLWLLMGLGMAGIGLSVMHDANHKAYSSHNTVNKVLGYMLNLVGGHSLNWKIQHNLLHHGYTNVDGFDEDIDPGKVIRLSPHKPRYRMHRYQHWYAWVLYGMMTLSWVISKDFKDLVRYREKGLSVTDNRSSKSMLTELIIWKVIYFTYMLVIPIILVPVPWWQIIILFISSHFLAGITLATIFQAAHVMPTSEYPLPDEKGNVENNWAIHQLLTTTNFSPNSRWFSWLIGGLNYQIEHHLFPNICHVHYRHIAGIVKNTATEFSLPYNVQPSFFLALQQHGLMLKKLGRS